MRVDVKILVGSANDTLGGIFQNKALHEKRMSKFWLVVVMTLLGGFFQKKSFKIRGCQNFGWY